MVKQKNSTNSWSRIFCSRLQYTTIYYAAFDIIWVMLTLTLSRSTRLKLCMPSITWLYSVKTIWMKFTDLILIKVQHMWYSIGILRSCCAKQYHLYWYTDVVAYACKHIWTHRLKMGCTSSIKCTWSCTSILSIFTILQCLYRGCLLITHFHNYKFLNKNPAVPNAP